MSVTTEQAALNIMFPNDNTKTINAVINNLISMNMSEDDAKSLLRSEFPNVTDWSF
tara:strand:- start:615 stop:782 length:168 start_codon:yes stop_codon:yes gene_type:complete